VGFFGLPRNYSADPLGNLFIYTIGTLTSLGPFFTVLSLFGVWVLFRENRDYFWMFSLAIFAFISPALLGIIFGSRLILPIVAICFLLSAYSIWFVFNKFSRRARHLTALFVLLLFGFLFWQSAALGQKWSNFSSGYEETSLWINEHYDASNFFVVAGERRFLRLYLNIKLYEDGGTLMEMPSRKEFEIIAAEKKNLCVVLDYWFEGNYDPSLKDWIYQIENVEEYLSQFSFSKVFTYPSGSTRENEGAIAIYC
jgi:hypothetical protein